MTLASIEDIVLSLTLSHSHNLGEKGQKDLTKQTEFPKLEEFLIGLQKSWEEVTKTMNIAKETIKRQFNKKR